MLVACSCNARVGDTDLDGSHAWICDTVDELANRVDYCGFLGAVYLLMFVSLSKVRTQFRERMLYTG